MPVGDSSITPFGAPLLRVNQWWSDILPPTIDLTPGVLSFTGGVNVGLPYIRSTSTYASAASETTPSPAFVLPDGWQAGDTVYIGYELTASNGVFNPPAGWTELFVQFRSAGTTNTCHGVIRRVMQGGDINPVPTYTSGRIAMAAAAVVGAHTTPEDVTPTTDDNTGVTTPSVRASSITGASNGDLILSFFALRNGINSIVTSFTPDPDLNEAVDVSSTVVGSSNAAIELAWLWQPVAGATGTQTATATGTDVSTINGMGSTIAVKSSSVVSTVNLTPGVLSFSGVAGEVQPVIGLTPGILALTGSAASVQPVVSITPGVLAFAGVGAAVQPKVDLTPGILAFAGQAAAVQPKILLTPGVISFTGSALGVGSTTTIDLTPGILVFTGSGLAVQRVVNLTPGSLGFQGVAGSIQPVLLLAPGILAFTGVGLGIQPKILLTPGILAFSGVELELSGFEIVLIDLTGKIRRMPFSAAIREGVFGADLHEEVWRASLI